MKIPNNIINEIVRLGGTSTSNALSDIKWPEGTFSWSIERIHEVYTELANENEYTLEDIFHPIRELEFVDPNVGFWPGWQEMFSGTDNKRFIPFSADEAYFYFIDSESIESNPNIYYVDHETTDEEPYHKSNFTLEVFLTILAKK